MRIKRWLRRAVLWMVCLLMCLAAWEMMRSVRRAMVKVSKDDGSKRSQELLDYMAENLAVVYQSEPSQRNRVITFINNGSKPIPAGDWEIYFNDMHGSTRVAQDGKMYLLDKGVIIRHHNGWFYSIIPIPRDPARNESFPTLTPKGGKFSVEFPDALNSRTYVFPRWYVAGSAPGLIPRILRSTESEDLNFVVRSEERGEQRPPNDRFSDNLYQREISGLDKMDDVGNEEELSRYQVIPTPLNVKIDLSQHVLISQSWKIYYETSLGNEASFLAEYLNIEKVESKDTGSLVNTSQVILLTMNDLSKQTLDNVNDPVKGQLTRSGAYVLTLDRGEFIHIRGQHVDTSGVFYGVQTLISLLDGSRDRRSAPTGIIADAPRLEYRGLLLDPARNFIEVDALVEVIDVMARYKMNKLHLHLSDDQGWRIEIPGLEELTEIGARRGHDLNETSMLLSSHGSGPSNPPQFYSTTEYRRMLAHAQKRHVTIIPEIDMPGHAHAAIQSMRVRHDRLLREGLKDKGEEFALSEATDKSFYRGVGEVKDSVMNPCLPSTKRWAEHVVREIVNLHKGVQDLKTFHLGGDEVPGEALSKSPSCNRLLLDHPELADLDVPPPSPTFNEPPGPGTPLNPEDTEVAIKKRREKAQRMHVLKRYFTRDLVDFITELGLDVQAWEEGFGADGAALPPNISTLWNTRGRDLIINTWNAGKDASFTFANAGYKVVISLAHNLYIDHPYESDFDERGIAWATGITNTFKVFNFMLPSKAVDNTTFSHKLLCDTLFIGHHIPLTQPQNVIGMEACLWGEMIRTKQQMQEMLFPRLLAVAERAWHMAAWEQAESDAEYAKRKSDWVSFSNTVGYKELSRLERDGIQYRISKPGARIIKDIVAVNTEFPGVIVEYAVLGEGEELESMGDKVTWHKYTTTTRLEFTNEQSQFLLRSTTLDGKRHSPVVYVRLPGFKRKNPT